MNQILDYEPNKPSSNKPSGGRSTSGAIKVFAILLIVFAIVVVILAATRLKSNKTQQQSANVNKVKATINVDQNDSDLSINVENDYEIEMLVYSWNGSNEINIKGEGTKTMKQTIPLPAGTNDFYLKVIDVKGNETVYEDEYTSESGKDILKPVIELTVTSDKKLKIVATDETALDFVTYRWNEDAEVTLTSNPESPKEIVATIEIPHGKNDITIIAVDSSNNAQTENSSYHGLTKPEIKFIVDESNPSVVQVDVKHENGLKGISGTINGSEFRISESDITSNELNFTLNLSVGLNIVQVSASSTDGTDNTVEKEFQYNNGSTSTAPEQENKPTVNVEIVEEDRNTKVPVVTMSYHKKIASCSVVYNGQSYDITIPENQLTPLEFKLPALVDGSNTLKITVTGTDNSVTEYVNTFAK